MSAITINLLPTEFRRKIEEPRVISTRFVLAISCLIAVLLWIGLGFMLGTIKSELNNILNDWGRLEAGSQEADKIMLDINQNYLERKKTCDLISTSEMSWSRVLNEISDLLPATAWLKRLRLTSSTLDEWEFWLKGVMRTPEDLPSIKAIGKFVSAIKPSLEQQLVAEKAAGAQAPPRPQVQVQVPGSLPPAPAKSLDVQTSTDQEVIDDYVLTGFEILFSMEAKKTDESLRDKRKPA